MDRGTQKLLEAIEDYKILKGIPTDDAWADSIGMEPSTWSKKKSGKAKFFKDDLDKIVKAHPILKSQVCDSIGYPSPAELSEMVNSK